MDVFSRDLKEKEFYKTSHCVIVFVSTNTKGKPIPVNKFVPSTPSQIEMEHYAKKLIQLRKNINSEMEKYL